MGCVMKKPTICICENKLADQLRSDCEADQSLCFCCWIVPFLSFLNPKFPASSHLLCLYTTVGVKPVRKPVWFFHDVDYLVVQCFDYVVYCPLYWTPTPASFIFSKSKMSMAVSSIGAMRNRWPAFAFRQSLK